MHLHYDRAQVRAAAEYIWQNNSMIHIWPSQPLHAHDVYEHIIELAVQHIKRNLQSDYWSNWVITGGFVILVSALDEDDNENFEMDVFVDPNVGNTGRYVSEYFDEDTF